MRYLPYRNVLWAWGGFTFGQAIALLCGGSMTFAFASVFSLTAFCAILFLYTKKD